ncbi:MAG: 4'-phosphopantetheinyl transferase superfamily protein [Dysgonamonadaceae bacterium]|nr:4'-phosphopantetheinyl transferase superfamily protein [Dysgonamonadaceae bacterium]
MNRLKVAPITETSDELLALLEHKERYISVLRKMSEHRKREWLFARVLLKRSLGEEKEIGYTGFGKPYLTDKSYHISISHTKNFVAVAWNKKKEVAIDIERISSRVKNIRTRFMSELEENNLSKENPVIHLLLHWSAKETLFKLLRENDIEFKTQLHILPFEPVINEWSDFTAYETRTEKRQSYTVYYIVTKDYVLTAIG